MIGKFLDWMERNEELIIGILLGIPYIILVLGLLFRIL